MYNLLLADDESIVRRGIKTLVDYAALGIGTVYEAETGQQALDIVQRGDVHIVFADINMPRMNGLEFARKALEFDSALKIALITGYDYFDYVLTALKLGVDDYILKPVSKDDVTELLIKLVEKRKTEDGFKSVLASADKLAGLAPAGDDDSLKHTLAAAIEKTWQVLRFACPHWPMTSATTRRTCPRCLKSCLGLTSGIICWTCGWKRRKFCSYPRR